MERPVFNRISTGITGLDTVLLGGLIAQRAYLIRGASGTGKTTIGLHFLAAGAALNESCLFINLVETEEQIRTSAVSIGLEVDKVRFLNLTAASTLFSESLDYNLFSAATIDREPINQRIRDAIKLWKPKRIFIDSIAQFRYLSSDHYQFRRQMYSMLLYLLEHQATVVFATEPANEEDDKDIQFMADGILHLSDDIGDRRVRVSKFRSSGYMPGLHAGRLTSGGFNVYPRLQPEVASRRFVVETLSTGLADLDQMMGGGIERGLMTILSGPTGIGKTSMGMQILMAAAARGERSVVYTFDEWRETLIARAESMGMPVRQAQDDGLMTVVQMDPIEYSAEELGQLIARDVEMRKTRFVMIDGVTGYFALRHGSGRHEQLYALAKFLQNRGVTLIATDEILRITGDFVATQENLGNLADNIFFMRYIEINSRLHRLIGVMKKRLSGYEKMMRQFEITAGGIRIGQPLQGVSGLLSGTLVSDTEEVTVLPPPPTPPDEEG